MNKNKKVTSTPPLSRPDSKFEKIVKRFENQEIWHLAFLFLLPYFVYIKTVGYLFINMDDVAIIVNNLDTLSHWKNIGTAFTTDAFLSPHGDFYRPLQTVSFMLDAFIGGERTWIYHLSNLVYHILTVISLYYLLRLLNLRSLTALFAALIFSVHPLLASAVSWVPARGDVLIGLFAVLLFTTFIKYINSRKTIYLVLHAILFVLAVFSKETAIILPVMLAFYFFIVRKNALQSQSIKTLLPFIIVWMVSFAVFYFFRSKVVTGTPPDFILGVQPFFQNLATIPSVIGKFIIPIHLSTLPLFEPLTTLIGVIILLFALWLVIKSIVKKNWLVIMGFAWFLVFIIPPMFFKLYYSRYLLEYYEHRTYLPLIGLMMVVAFYLDTIKSNRKLYIGLPATCILIFTFIASAQSDSYKNSIAFFTNAMELGNPGAATKRGEFYMDQRDFTNALSDFNEAIDLSNGEYPPAFYNRGIVNSTFLKNHAAAEQDLTQTILLDSSYIEAYIKRAEERIFSSNFNGALDDLQKAKIIDSTNVHIYYTKAKVLTSSMQFKAALPAFSKAISMDTTSAEMYNDRAYVRYRLQDLDSALIDVNKAIQLFPQFLNAYYNKGMIYLEQNKPQIAINTFDTTLMLADNFYFGHFYRGMARKQVNDMKGACQDWQEAVNLGFTMAQDTIRKYCK